MTRWLTGLGLGFSLLTTSVLCRSSYALPQEAGVGVEQSTGVSSLDRPEERALGRCRLARAPGRRGRCDVCDRLEL
jgi:hypothetical protein